MRGNRIAVADERAALTGREEAFVAVPGVVAMPGSFQQQLYLWAYEQAQQALALRQPARLPDLFAIMN
jgi:hypothetical protein